MVDNVRKKINTKQKIIEAARKSFAEKGYNGVSMSEIAKEAKVKKALIYYYFPSKEELFYEVWHYSMDELETHLFNEVENENMYLKKLKKLLKSYIDFMTNKTEVQRIILRERVNFSRTDQDSWKRVKDRYMSLRERVSNLIEESKNLEVIDSNVDSNDAADLILNGLSSSNDPRSLENIREIIWRGLVKNE